MKTAKVTVKLIPVLLALFIMAGCSINGSDAGSNGRGTGSEDTGQGESVSFNAMVELDGGSGRAHIESPCLITIEDGRYLAHIIWSSSNYDYMIVDGTTYYPINSEGPSQFVIPVALDEEVEFKADTTAMSTPHLIDYTAVFRRIEDGGENGDFADPTSEQGDAGADVTGIAAVSDMSPPVISGVAYESTEENQYASGFRIHRYSDGVTVISVEDGRNYLLVPEGKECPADLSKDITVLQKPLDRIYLAASSVMCHIDSIGAIDNVVLSGLKRDDWYVDGAIRAMDEGTLAYGGKYSAPDYEKIVGMDIDLAIENTMLLHSPNVREKLEELGVPVFIDRSNYEDHPLGRMEWITVYGELTDRRKEAGECFSSQKALVTNIAGSEIKGRSVAIFSVNSNHLIVTRKRDDYFAMMVEMAGGSYLAPPIEDDIRASSQVTLSVESFFGYAADADILIYNATIQSAPEDIEALKAMDETLGSFRAIKDGSVWCTDKSLYQFANRTGTIIDDLGSIIGDDQEVTTFFYRLK